MQGETPQQALMRAAQVAGYRAGSSERERDEARRVIERVMARDELEPGCTLSPPHDLLRHSCVKVAGEWVVFRRLDERGHLVVSKPGSCAEWTYEPEPGALLETCEPF